MHGLAQFFDSGVFNGAEDGLCDFDPSEPFEVCWDDAPGCVGGVGFEEHVFGGLVVFAPFPSVAPVFIRDFPMLVRVRLAPFKAGQLFLF